MAVYLISVAIVDATGDRKTAQVYIDPGTATLAQLTTWAQGLASVLDAVSDGAIQDINLSLSIPLPGGLDDTPVAGTDIQRGALFGFDAANTAYRHSVWVPAFADGSFSGDVVDEANAGVQAFEDYLTTTVNTIRASDKYGNHLNAEISGVKSFRK